MSSDTATLRSFNRAWSQRVGALEESFLGTGLSLGASRLLFEMGSDGASVLDLRRRLGLDSGYLSRLMRGLEAEGLVSVRRDATDHRRRKVVPTAKGKRALTRLDDRSEDRAAGLLASLGRTQRRRLDDALATAERLIRAATITIEPVPAGSPEAIGSVRRYFAELDERFSHGFDVGDAATEEIDDMSAPKGAFLLAMSDGEAAACGGVRAHRGSIGEIKRMWVDPVWRGCGLGGRMLAALEDQARDLGYDEVYLDSNGTLVEAITMYERTGYRSIERYNDNPYAERWFAKTL